MKIDSLLNFYLFYVPDVVITFTLFLMTHQESLQSIFYKIPIHNPILQNHTDP